MTWLAAIPISNLFSKKNVISNVNKRKIEKIIKRKKRELESLKTSNANCKIHASLN